MRLLNLASDHGTPARSRAQLRGSLGQSWVSATLRRIGLILQRFRGQKFLGGHGLLCRHLDQDASRSHGVTVQAERRQFVHDDRMKLGRLEPRPDEVRIGGIEGARNGDECHGSGRQRLFVIGKHDDPRAGLQQALHLDFDLLADGALRIVHDYHRPVRQITHALPFIFAFAHDT